MRINLGYKLPLVTQMLNNPLFIGVVAAHHPHERQPVTTLRKQCNHSVDSQDHCIRKDSIA